MTRSLCTTTFLLLLIGSLAAQDTKASRPTHDVRQVDFKFAFDHGQTRAHIEMRVLGLDRDRLEVAMPVWSPGSYEIANHAKKVSELRAASADGKPLAVAQPDPATWSIATRGLPSVVITYELDARRAGLGRRLTKDAADGSKTTYHKAYQFEGPQTWLYIKDRIDVPQEVTFAIPADWKIATGMERTADPHTLRGADYDVFADCPFRIGDFESRTFEVEGVPYQIVWSGFERDRHNREAIAARYAKIVGAQLAMMGKAPFDHYVFLIHWPGGAGLEHLSSTNITMMELGGSTPESNSIWDSLISHEFFHLWNVKRLRPRRLGPFDYSQAVRTPYLWFCEGVTSYYGDLLLVRAGVWNEQEYWTGSIAEEINILQNNPGRLKMSVAQASRTVWDRGYMQSGSRAPDYYNKGELLGLLLDIEIRDATDNRHSLDDVMRGLYRQCMDEGHGFADGDVQRWCEKVAGRSFAEFFARYVEGTEELPFAADLPKIGLALEDLPRPAAAPASKPQSASSVTSQPASKPEQHDVVVPRGRFYRVRILEEAPQKALRLRRSMVSANGR